MALLALPDPQETTRPARGTVGGAVCTRWCARGLIALTAEELRPQIYGILSMMFIVVSCIMPDQFVMHEPPTQVPTPQSALV